MKIKEERKNRFGSQLSASWETGIPQINISRWEIGTCSPKFFTLRSYLGKLGIRKGFLGNKEYIIGSKYKGFRIKRIKSTILTPEKAYVLGVTGPGDGFISGEYQIGLDATDKEFVDYFQNCLEKTFGLECKRYTNENKVTNFSNNAKRRHIVRLCSKSAVESFKKFKVSFKECKWRVPNEIFNASERCKSMYLKGVFDSQGSVAQAGKFMTIKIKNKEGIRQIQKLLIELTIDSYILKDETILQLSGHKNLALYGSKVGFIIKRKMKSLKNILDFYVQKHPTRKDVIEVLPKMIELRKNNLSYREIASMTEIGRGSVGRNLQKLGY
ncbi:hypothetical protein HYT57_05260 [Candidatus Woesearchaeota archaeon]|nr:hypothetical protein [Candidatus Woesearchaeota archaeon]